jgi:hypothetical protein
LVWQIHRVRKKLYKLRENRHSKKHPRSLRNFERRHYSQNGEDGVIEEIFRRIGATNRRFVEFGVQDGTQCCTRNLLEAHDWAGVWIECDPAHVVCARSRFRESPITVIEAFLTADNIQRVFASAGVPTEPDLMVVDVDGNDYWMWKAVGEHYRPRVVVVEYNGTFGPNARWAMPYDPQHRYDETAYFGASLASFVELARSLGYCLVGCESMGVNAFFVRQDCAVEQFDGFDRSTRYHYVAPHYDGWFGHAVINQRNMTLST